MAFNKQSEINKHTFEHWRLWGLKKLHCVYKKKKQKQQKQKKPNQSSKKKENLWHEAVTKI